MIYWGCFQLVLGVVGGFGGGWCLGGWGYSVGRRGMSGSDLLVLCLVVVFRGGRGGGGFSALVAPALVINKK